MHAQNIIKLETIKINRRYYNDVRRRFNKKKPGNTSQRG